MHLLYLLRSTLAMHTKTPSMLILFCSAYWSLPFCLALHHTLTLPAHDSDHRCAHRKMRVSLPAHYSPKAIVHNMIRRRLDVVLGGGFIVQQRSAACLAVCLLTQAVGERIIPGKRRPPSVTGLCPRRKARAQPQRGPERHHSSSSRLC